MEHIKYPSIKQFRNIVYDINRNYAYVGLDENEEPIYDNSRKKPILTFTGTVKIHGTNASVCLDKESNIYYQSRKNIITLQKDNAGFAMFAESNKDIFVEMFETILANVSSEKQDIVIYGEWAGKGIQRGVAISELDKSFFIFGVKYGEDWLNCSTLLSSPENKIYNINDFQKYSIEIDFNQPELSQNKIIDMTIGVENECPVAKQLGISGVGEGIVFQCFNINQNYMFKSKGEKHSKSKVKN